MAARVTWRSVGRLLVPAYEGQEDGIALGTPCAGLDNPFHECRVLVAPARGRNGGRDLLTRGHAQVGRKIDEKLLLHPMAQVDFVRAGKHAISAGNPIRQREVAVPAGSV